MYLDSILLAHKDSWHLKDGTSIKIKSFFFPLMLLFSSVAQSCLTLCDPMDCSAPGFPVHHQPLELAQTPVHRVSDAINHLILYCPLLLLPSVLFSIRVFSSESALRSRWPKYWSSTSVLPMNIQDWFPLGWTGWICLQSKGLSGIFSNTTVSKASILRHFLYNLTLTSIHDYWKNHSFD